MWPLCETLCGWIKSRPVGSKRETTVSCVRYRISNCCHEEDPSLTLLCLSLWAFPSATAHIIWVLLLVDSGLYVMQLSRSVNTSALRAGRDSTHRSALRYSAFKKNHCLAAFSCNQCAQYDDMIKLYILRSARLSVMNFKAHSTLL